MLKSPADPPLDQGPEYPQPAAFGSAEKSLDPAEPPRAAETEDAPMAVSPIDAAFAACRAVGGGHGVFGNPWMDRLHQVVRPAYGLLCLTHDKPDELARLAYRAKVRFTAATEKNLALLCVKLAARPKDTDQDKVCSEWSALLRCALAQNISADGFIAWVGTTTVGECKATIAREKAAARAQAGQPPRKRGRARLDEARADGTLGSAAELSDVLASIQTAVLDALTAPGSETERRERVIASLRGFADSLASDGVIETENEHDNAAGEGPVSV